MEYMNILTTTIDRTSTQVSTTLNKIYNQRKLFIYYIFRKSKMLQGKETAQLFI